MKNRIYFFTGTGNSFYIAKKVAEKMGDCEVIAINKDTSLELSEGYERIGVIFPCYGGGMPSMVKKFLEKLEFPVQNNTYLFAITSCGGNAGETIPMVKKIIESKGWELNYGGQIMAFPNAVTLYPMFKLVNFFNKRTNNGVDKHVSKIINKENCDIKELSKGKEESYAKMMAKFKETDTHYNVNGKCNGCKVCVKVCPSRNVEMKDGKPKFNGNCESCMACIQMCPRKAINYKDKTQKRRRYINPNVTVNETIEYNK